MGYLVTNQPPERPRGKPRKAVLVSLVIFIGLLFMMVASQVAFNLAFLHPNTSEQTLIFAAVSTLIFLLFIGLTFVLLRNLLKLYAERRLGVLGSKFRTRMVLGALLLSFTPVIFLFLFAYGLMNRSIDKWFSRPVEELREDAGQVAIQLSRYAADNASAEAAAIAELPEIQRAFQIGNFSGVINEFRRRQRTLQGGFALALSDGDAVAGYNAPLPWGELRSKIHPATLAGKAPGVLDIQSREYMVGSASVGSKGLILVATPLPVQFRESLNHIEQSERKYLELSSQRKQVRRTYMGLLLLLTMVVLFASTWFALFLSKLVTRPVEALAEATQEISRGRLDYRVEVHAADELGELVSSFNRMAAELETTRRVIEASRGELAEANTELEQRRRHMEAILESIPTGVLSLDEHGKLTRANHALVRMFMAGSGNAPQRSFPTGARLSELFSPEVVEDLEKIMRRADRMGSFTGQMEVMVQRARLNVAVTVASLRQDNENGGYVIVFEDLSDLLKAQRQTAWREVARRVAHEIKNPLTPIALSAERILRHLDRIKEGKLPEEASLGVIHGCAETIAGAVETVRGLVDEFSAMARFPTSQPQPADINTIVQSALAMFNGRLDGIQLQTFLAPGLPCVMADPNAMKRAIANLVDNAAEAVQGSLVREVQISTALLAESSAVELVIADTGPGVTREDKEKLFLPYFSTKQRGTGLGLAIVGRIIEDHHGSIRVEENSPLGARFVVELPLAGAAEGKNKTQVQPA